MKLTQEQKVKLVGRGIQVVAGVGFVSLLGYLFYNLATANSKGLERAYTYEKEKGKKKPYQCPYSGSPCCPRNCSPST